MTQQRRAVSPHRSSLARLLLALLALTLVLTAFSGCQSVEEDIPPIDYLPDDTGTPDSPSLPINSDVELATGEPDADGVELLGVSLSTEGAYVMVRFMAPPEVATNWWEGSVYLIDEATNAVYSDVPTLPTVGPLIARPKELGQAGYFMLTNQAPHVQSGSVVSVVLGRFKRVHVAVQ